MPVGKNHNPNAVANPMTNPASLQPMTATVPSHTLSAYGAGESAPECVLTGTHVVDKDAIAYGDGVYVATCSTCDSRIHFDFPTKFLDCLKLDELGGRVLGSDPDVETLASFAEAYADMIENMNVMLGALRRANIVQELAVERDKRQPH